MWDFQHTPLTPRYIHLVRETRHNRWSDSGPIASGTTDPRNSTMIGSNNESDTKDTKHLSIVKQHIKNTKMTMFSDARL